MSTGLVLFAHGARDPRWGDTIAALARRVEALAPDVPVRAAFLEFMEPDLDGAIDALVGCGVGSVVVAPVFLAAGGHVLRDLPARLAAVVARHHGLQVRMEPALGSLPCVLDAMARHCVDSVIQATPRFAHVASHPCGATKKGMDAP